MYVSPVTRSLEDTFAHWARPPGKTEAARCKNAVGAIRNAIAKSPKLSGKNLKVFVQGSYRNRVNVRQDSDVDVGVLCSDSFFTEYREGATASFFRNTAATYTYSEFKNDLGEALVAYFGHQGVHRGNKAFDLGGNTYRVEADVAPFFEHRHYRRDTFYAAGVALVPDHGGLIVNYPEKLLDYWPDLTLHYENGVLKNTATSRRFKGVVRILKKVRNEMASAGILYATPIPGFLIECLIWNVTIGCFTPTTWEERVRSILLSLWSGTRTDAECGSWTEVNGIKRLFAPDQSWTRRQAHEFVDAAWRFLGMRSS